MKTMPRLVDDQRKRRCLVGLIMFVAFSTLITVGALNVEWMNERWRHEGLTLLKELKSQSKWLENEMNVACDATMLAAKIDAVEERLSGGDAIVQSDVDFTIGTRTLQSQENARKSADRCVALLSDLADVRGRMSGLFTDGTNMLFTLKACAASKSAEQIELTRSESDRRCRELQEWCSKKWVLSLAYKSVLGLAKRFTCEVGESRYKDEGWQRVGDAHSSYVSWTNSFVAVNASWDATMEALHKSYLELQQYPFDSENAVKLTQRIMRDEIERADSVMSVGVDLIGNSLRRADDMLVHYNVKTKNHYNALLELQKEHGDYVASSVVTSALQYVESFQALEDATHKTISARIITMRESVVLVGDGRRGAEQILLSLEKPLSEDKIAAICRKGQSMIRTLTENDIILKTRIEALTNYIPTIQFEAKDKVCKVEELKSVTERSFPDWRIEGGKIISELDAIRRSIATVRAKARSIQKSLVTYRDCDVNKTIANLHNRLDKIFDMLKTIEEACSGMSPCSTGVEMRALVQKRDKAKRLVDLVEQKVVGVAQDMERAIKDRALQRIKFVKSTRSFAEQLQQGMRHFDFALDIPNGGRHQVELRFAKGGRSLYKMSPQRKHKIVMSCGISGVVNRDAELSWDDLTSSWCDSILVEEEFTAGVNDINLDIIFNAQDSKGEILRGGMWQYQYDNGFFTTDMRDNFSVEFWLDGVKKDILWGEPES